MQARVGGEKRKSDQGTISKVWVNENQRGNHLLQKLTSIAWEIGPTSYDFQVGDLTGILYICLRYHLAHGKYLEERMKRVSALKRKVLVCHVDVVEYSQSMVEINALCVSHGFTCIVAANLLESARYIESYFTFERSTARKIKKRIVDGETAVSCLTSIQHINKTDATTLLKRFRSLAGIMEASLEELLLCNGMGERKARAIQATFQSSLRA